MRELSETDNGFYEDLKETDSRVRDEIRRQNAKLEEMKRNFEQKKARQKKEIMIALEIIKKIIEENRNKTPEELESTIEGLKKEIIDNNTILKEVTHEQYHSKSPREKTQIRVARKKVAASKIQVGEMQEMVRLLRDAQGNDGQEILRQRFLKVGQLMNEIDEKFPYHPERDYDPHYDKNLFSEMLQEENYRVIPSKEKIRE